MRNTTRTRVTASKKRENCITRPNYDLPCLSCEQVPTVDLYSTDGKRLLHHMDLCGPCCFGEADCIDPANW